MPVTWSTNPNVWEYEASRKESFTPRGLVAEVKLMCPWADRYTVMTEIITGGQIYPPAPDSGAIAQNGTCVPFQAKLDSDGQQGIDVEFAVISISYSVFKPGQQDQQQSFGGNLFSESLDPTAEFLTVEHSNMRWGASDGPKLKASEAPGKLVVGFDYVITWYGLTTLPSEVRTAVSKVNNAVLDSYSLNMSFAAETLLFQPSSPSRNVDVDGNGKWDLPMRFSYRENGWNKFWRPDKQQWLSIYVQDKDDDSWSEYKNFPLTSFSNLTPF